MNIVKEALENQAALIKVTVSSADYSEAVEKALKNYKKKANIPGFRPGMVPMGIVNKMYRKGVTAEEAYRTASSAIISYLDENKIEILGDPMPSTSQKPLDFEKETEFEFAFEVGLAPEMNIDLSKITVTEYNITADKEMKEKYTENYLRRFGKLVDVETVTSDEALSVTLDQEAMNIEDAYVGLVGMSEEERKPFIGMKVGSTLDVDVNELYKQASQRAAILQMKEEELAAIDPKFKLTVTRIRKFETPAITEEFLKEAFPAGEVKTAEEFEKMITEKIDNDLSQESKYKRSIDIRQATLDGSNLTLPEPFLKNWLFSVNEGKFTMEEIEKEFPQFIEMMKWDVIKRFYGKEGEIKISKEDAVSEAKTFAAMQFAQYGMPNVDDNMLSNYADSILANKEEAQKIYDRIAETKVIDYIAPKLTTKKKKISHDDFLKLFE